MTAKELRDLIVAHESAITEVDYDPPNQPGIVTLTLHIPKPYAAISDKEMLLFAGEVRTRTVDWLYQEVLDVGISLRSYIYVDGVL